MDIAERNIENIAHMTLARAHNAIRQGDWHVRPPHHWNDADERKRRDPDKPMRRLREAMESGDRKAIQRSTDVLREVGKNAIEAGDWNPSDTED